MTAEDVRERVRKLLEQNNWTVYRRAKESGLANSTVYNMKNRGTYPKHETLEKICEAFHITVADFLEEKKPDLILTTLLT